MGGARFHKKKQTFAKLRRANLGAATGTLALNGGTLALIVAFAVMN